MMENERISTFLGELRDNVDESLVDSVLKFEDYWERKLWHELTEILLGFYDNEKSTKSRIPIYENFIKSFADKINQLKLVKLALGAAQQIQGWCSPLL